MAQPSSGSGYDYFTALQNLQNKIRNISEQQQQQQGSRSPFARVVQNYKANWPNAVALLTFYVIAAAAVPSVMFAEKQKKAEQRAYEEQYKQWEAQKQR
eukprot:jgi/Chrzof1/10623/Cz05g05170.t1